MNEPDIGMIEPEWDDFPCCAPKAAVTHASRAGDDIQPLWDDIHGYVTGARRVAVIAAVFGFCSVVWVSVIIGLVILGGA